jgi:DNA modification methylase
MRVDELYANPHNWRRHPKHQAEALDGVLTEIGWVQSVVFNQKTGHLIDGHLRVELAKHQKELTVPVTVVDLTEEEEINVLATFDPISAAAESDKEMLEKVLDLAKLQSEAATTLLAKLRASEKIRRVSEPPEREPTNPDEIKTDIKRGDAIRLGNHVLWCGDSSDEFSDDFHLTVTSPPYFNQRPEYSNFKDYSEYLAMCVNVIHNLYRNANDETGTVCWNVGSSEQDNLFIPADHYKLFIESGFTWTECISWVKESAAWSIPRSQHIDKGMYIPALRWEPIFVFIKKNRPYFDIKDLVEVKTWQENVWNMAKVIGSAQVATGHPAMYPVELAKRCILSFSKKGQVVMDPFMGSGSTLIACEMTNRECHGFEIRPEYCEVTARRWESYTNKVREYL